MGELTYLTYAQMVANAGGPLELGGRTYASGSHYWSPVPVQFEATGYPARITSGSLSRFVPGVGNNITFVTDANSNGGNYAYKVSFDETGKETLTVSHRSGRFTSTETFRGDEVRQYLDRYPSLKATHEEVLHQYDLNAAANVLPSMPHPDGGYSFSHREHIYTVNVDQNGRKTLSEYSGHGSMVKLDMEKLFAADPTLKSALNRAAPSLSPIIAADGFQQQEKGLPNSDIASLGLHGPATFMSNREAQETKTLHNKHKTSPGVEAFNPYSREGADQHNIRALEADRHAVETLKAIDQLLDARQGKGQKSPRTHIVGDDGHINVKELVAAERAAGLKVGDEHIGDRVRAGIDKLHDRIQHHAPRH